MTAADPLFYVERARTSVRNRRIHDWRLTLLPAAIDAEVGLPALRVCNALCSHQRGRHPVVYLATDALAEELGMEKRNVKRAIRQLERAGLLRVIIGGGRQPVPEGHHGKANTYILGPSLAGDVEAVIKGVRLDTLSARTRVSGVTPYPETPELINSVRGDTPPLRGTSYPSGGSGERTAALTGGSSPAEPSPTIAPHRLRDLFRGLSLGKGGSPNAL